ncbi:MAG: YwaF family protein [Erysipelotrichaceae bacterium]|nr:YwaF family protein [Erysipelotrichaceae bacterium]
MFSTGHLIWITICTILIVIGLYLYFHFRFSLRKVLFFSLIAGFVSEVIKLFCVSEIVPMVDPYIVNSNGNLALEWLPSGEYTPYLPLEHLPLELCSLYLPFMLLCLVIKDETWKKRLYALMFASGTIGGFMGIVLSSIAGKYSSPLEFFTSIRAWQFFLYHAMIVAVSLYIGFSEEGDLHFSDCKKAICALLILDLPTFYLNSLFSSEVYVNDKIVGVTHRINFFSSYVNPLGLVLTEKWQWILYLIIRAILALILVLILYSLLRFKKRGKHENS